MFLWAKLACCEEVYMNYCLMTDSDSVYIFTLKNTISWFACYTLDGVEYLTTTGLQGGKVLGAHASRLCTEHFLLSKSLP